MRAAMSRRLTLALTAACMLTLAACGDESGASPPAKAALRFPDIQHFTLIGTVDGEAATGEMVLTIDGGGVNLLQFRIVSFSFGELRGEGFAQILTIDNTFTILLTVDAPFLGYVQVAGRRRFPMGLGWEIPSFDDFTLSGGADIDFAATADG
jgi:hypothetical protein